MTATRTEFLVLGAGPTGLGAAWRLEEQQIANWRLIESQNQVGGLSSSFVDRQGFTWDLGGHVLFSHYDYFDTVMDDLLSPDQWLVHEREAWIWMRDRFIPYPLQNNLHHLPIEDLEECLNGLADVVARHSVSSDNFYEWIIASFGEGIARLFMLPYNYKVWAHSPKLMSASWVGERVAIPDLKGILHNLLYRCDDTSWGPNSTFRFPINGGTGAIWRTCASRLPSDKLTLGTTVVEIDPQDQTVLTDKGDSIDYDFLISTIPLDQLVMISHQSGFMPLVRDSLLHSSSWVFGIGLRGTPPEHLRSKCWIYFPEGDCPFYRVTVFSNYSPRNVPNASEFWSLIAEVSESKYKPVDPAVVSEEVIAGLLNTQLIVSRDDIASFWQHRVEHGYPIPSSGRDASLRALVPWYEEHNIFPRGRFGSWKYEVGNQDHSFMQGVEIVERLLHGHAEITVVSPIQANQQHHAWPFEEWL